MLSHHFITTFVGCFFSILALQPSFASDELPVFEVDVQPIFIQKCGNCHSQNVQKASLDLSKMDGLRRGGESGEPIVSSSLKENALWLMIDAGEMPPSDQPQLTPEEIKIIRQWIINGVLSREPSLNKEVVNQHDVMPILLLRCVACHGRQLKEGKLDLRSPETIQQGGRRGPILVAGNPDASLMIQRIESGACPPREKLLKSFVKRPSPAETKIIRDWIARGALITPSEADVATSQPDPLVSDEDRRHWAFQSPQKPSAGKSVDDFIQKRLGETGLALSPEADRETLIRRVYYDLIGLPPSTKEWEHWKSHQDADWYAQMIDELLNSPHYGQRWGRYWLDVAGYADSEGGVSADPVRKVAWKYRDYVVQAFNEDKPYDRFLTEQIAGDELADYSTGSNVTDEIVENLVATGFLRMGIDQTGSRTMNFVPERLGVIDDAIRILGSGVMGITLECAKCHSHKYDPIPHRDYYRFKSIFQGAFDEHDWLTFKNRLLQVATEESRWRVEKNNPPLMAKLKNLDLDLKQAIVEFRLATLRHHYPNQTEIDRQATLQALRIADNVRSQTQRILVEKLQVAEGMPESDQPESVMEARRNVLAIEEQIRTVRREMEPPLEIRALWDRGEPSPTYVLRRGEHDKPGRLVGPGVPSVLTNGKTPFQYESPFPGKTGRRLAFARWLTGKDHPLTSRVMVNRIWHHHFGNGLVKTLENFGLQGEKPSHPQLLDWLAIEFVNSGWSIKEMHRLIMNSRTYRQTSRISIERQRKDPQNRLLSRMSMRRLDAEALRDSLLFVSGKLDDSPGGPPDAVSVDREGLVSVYPTARGGWRRSLYVQYRRTEIPTLMDAFDYPEMGPNCVSRSVSIVSPQSLMLLNNGLVHDLSEAFARRILRLTGKVRDPGVLIDSVYAMALSRSPTIDERQLGVETLAELVSLWKGDRDAALTTYCHTVLNSAAFLYVD